LSEPAQAADTVRLTADESLHAAMLGARQDWQSSEGLPVLDAPDPLPLDAPLTATWALTTPLAVEAMGGDFVASQGGPGEATPLSPPPMTGYEQTAGATYTYFQKISATDPLGRLSSVKDYMGTVGNNPGAACPAPAWAASPNGTTSYQYDVADRLTMTTAPDNAQIQISYDALGRKTQMSDPDMGTWSYAYDQVSNLTRQTDASEPAGLLLLRRPGTAAGKTFPRAQPPQSGRSRVSGYAASSTTTATRTAWPWPTARAGARDDRRLGQHPLAV
jgi:YD repeat-containing protein